MFEKGTVAMPTEWSVMAAWALAFALVWWLTPKLSGLAVQTGLIDRPGGRHTHLRETPMLGGLAIYAGVMAAMLFAPRLPLLVTGTLALLVGLTDDYLKSRGKELSPLPKIAGQLLPAVVLIAWGTTIGYVTNPLGPGVLYLPWWVDYPVTLIWLVGMTNAVNFIDGLDGLAAGVVSVAAFTLLVMALVKDAGPVAIWVAAILGANVAFLRYNFHPASVFMGDAGSNFLGFVLAAVSVTGYFKATTLAGLAAPVLALSLPVLNGLFVVTRRVLNGQKFYEGQRDHTFDLLKSRMGLSTMETVLTFMLVAMILSGTALGLALTGR
jgi:UDP-GlcNAc:undecaprenyl-phosphate/decaprenyl-phosphate GlcNAc-1-phosphate transferase